MFFDAYSEHLKDEHNADVYAADVARARAYEGAPVRGEEGWSEELEAEREAAYARIGR